jgi:hypothetical protein
MSFSYQNIYKECLEINIKEPPTQDDKKFFHPF